VTFSSTSQCKQSFSLVINSLKFLSFRIRSGYMICRVSIQTHSKYMAITFRTIRLWTTSIQTQSKYMAITYPCFHRASLSLSLSIPTGALRSLLYIRSLFQHCALKTRKTHFFKTLVKNNCGPSLKFQHVWDKICPSSGSLKCSWLKLSVAFVAAYRLFLLCW
jgi:hypothetical protein